MTAKLPTGLVLFLWFLGSVLAQDDSLCNYECVYTDVYRPYCGGAVCVTGAINDAQRERLCSEECSNAIVGSPMRDCVLSQNPNIMNLASELQNMVADIRLFCDNAEPSMTAPGSAPASEPLTPSSEAPISANAPDSSIPIDPPESAPPSEKAEPSTTAEPSIAAESSTPAKPSIAAESSLPAEPPIATISFIAVEPSVEVESPIAAESSVEAPLSEPVESPKAMDSDIADVFVPQPEDDFLEYDDGEVLEALDML